MTLTNVLKSGFTALLVAGTLLLTGCGDTASSRNEDGVPFKVTGTLTQCPADSMFVYMLDGYNVRRLSAAPITQTGGQSTFTLEGSVPMQGFYWIGTSQTNLLSLILGGETAVELSGNCGNLPQLGKVTNSPVNQKLKEFGGRFNKLQQQVNALSQQVSMMGGNAPSELKDQVQSVFQQQVKLIDSLKQTDPILAKVFSLNVLPPFDPTNNPNGYASQMEHFAGEYYRYADLSDPQYDYIPVLADNVMGFTQNLFMTGSFPQEKAQAALDSVVGRLPNGSIAQRNVLLRIMYLLEQIRSGVYSYYANQYLAANPTDPNAGRIQQVARQLEQLAAQQAEKDRLFGVGKVPPNITLPTPEGGTVSLSDLRGKVVLVDFWASWCRPCRQENPNVVRVYNQYKSKGFEILGVSLDEKRGAWLQAIEADKLTWFHGSDLKGWRSAAAQKYLVSSIPQTFLLDREGRILGKNLRGAALEQKLAEVFAGS